MVPVEEWPTGAVFACMADSMAALVEAEKGTQIQAKRYPMTLRGLRAARLAAPSSEAASEEAGRMPDAEAKRTDAPVEFPTVGEISAAFSADGIVGGLYEGFEPRIEQSIMAESVLKAFSTSTNLVVEAGTGVGKSMAYLMPSA
ncbi:MAG: hypothetical protein ACLT98_09625 [Eggerthellaceae bacterium]